MFRVLAIDDDQNDQFVVERWAQRTALAPTVKLLDSGRAAMEYLGSLPESSPDLPHVIICDIKMPGVDGFDFLAWLRKSPHRHIPVVMWSASPVDSDVARAYALGANSYMVKQVDIRKTEQRIDQLIHYWRDIAEVPGR